MVILVQIQFLRGQVRLHLQVVAVVVKVEQLQVVQMVEKVETHLFQLVVKLQLPQMEVVVVQNMKLTQTQELMVQVEVQDTKIIQLGMVQMEQQDKDLMVEIYHLQHLNKVEQVEVHQKMEQVVEQHHHQVEVQVYLLL